MTLPYLTFDALALFPEIMADEFEQVNPITRRVLAGEMTRRQLGTFYKFMKYEDQDMNDVIGWKRDIQGPDAKGHIKWDLTREGHRKFQSLVKYVACLLTTGVFHPCLQYDV